MPYVITTATQKIFSLSKRIWALPGGTSAGKTIGVLQVLIDKAQTDKALTITSIVSESLPHLKRGAIRDFKNILTEQNYWSDKQWNATDCIYTFETGSIIEFFGADQSDKVRGPRRDRLFMNEANNIPFETFNQLEIRTKELIILDWNPTNEFWYYTEIKGKRDDVEEVTLTYKDNEGLDPNIIASIEQRKGNKSWWRVYGEGLLGEIEGKIYKNWQIIDEVPGDARLIRRGLDFGFTNDPAALVDIYKWNNGYVLDEQFYQLGMHNRPIAEFIKLLPEPETLIIADSAEPKSIDELKMYGLNVLPSTKGPGSVKRGIDFVQDQVIYITKRSVNGINEYRNCIWLVDKDGKVLNEEDPKCANHFLSAARYGLESLRPQNPEIITQQRQHWQQRQTQQQMNSTR